MTINNKYEEIVGAYLKPILLPVSELEKLKGMLKDYCSTYHRELLNNGDEVFFGAVEWAVKRLEQKLNSRPNVSTGNIIFGDGSYIATAENYKNELISDFKYYASEYLKDIKGNNLINNILKSEILLSKQDKEALKGNLIPFCKEYLSDGNELHIDDAIDFAIRMLQYRFNVRRSEYGTGNIVLGDGSYIVSVDEYVRLLTEGENPLIDIYLDLYYSVVLSMPNSTMHFGAVRG